MRVAARRLRCALKNFAPLLDEEWARCLAGELAWVARELGAIRDTEVLLERLDRHADRLGPADGALAKAVIDHRLRQRLASARSGALGALRSDRHEWLLDDLVAAAASPTSSERADAPCIDVLPPIIDHVWHALETAMSALRIDGPDKEWHEARIKAKRARYAVEAVAPTFGKRSWRFAAVLAELTEALGEHQDSSVAQGLLRELAAGDLVDCSTAFALGRLHGFEAEQAAVARRQIIIGWPAVIRRARRSGLVRHAGR
jgi:CHAD domain-containing protein